MSEHTPGEWRLGERKRDRKNGGETRTLYGNGFWLGDIRASSDEEDGNAALICAAPDLLSACKLLLEHGLDDMVTIDGDFAIAAAEAAIAKAETT